MSDVIRIRASLAVVQDNKILLVPHYDTDVGSLQWLIPGGRVRFGESLRQAALREFCEESSLQARITGLLDVSEVILPQKAWHSITVTFRGTIASGELASEAAHRYGHKMPRWFSAQELQAVHYHPKKAVEKALGIDVEG